jgi:flavin reductase (DIM6/NTAB) family NADH-FMN oxidoreductase RutF
MDKKEFFEIMASFPTGVAIVTTVDQHGAPVGLTTSAICSVSAEPPLLLVCVDRSSRTLPALSASRRFLVHLVREGRDETCTRFASKQADKFRDIAWRPNPSGLPLLYDDAFAWLECGTMREIAAGDHLVIIGLVKTGRIRDDDLFPTVYFRRSYRGWERHREAFV